MYPAPSDDQILAILGRHGLSSGVVEASPHEGFVNHVRMVGEFCVRVLKDEDYASDIRTEVVSVPALREIGVVTPELLVFDASREIVPGLATVYRRVPGLPFGESRPTDHPEAVVREIGVQIARWLEGLKRLEDPQGWLDKPRHKDLGEVYEGRAERLSPAERTWTEATIRRLETAKESPPAFVHWDLHPHNVLVDQGRFVAVIDWGDAGWGDPALNYGRMPAYWLPLLLDPLGDTPSDFVGRCLYGILANALDEIHEPEDATKPYAHKGHARWRSLQALTRRRLPEGWREWLGDGPA